VVDTGRTGRETEAFLEYRGKSDVDALILSHGHPDHSGGLTRIVKSFDVHELWDNGLIEYPDELLTHTMQKSVKRGDMIDESTYTLTVLHPYKEFYSLFGREYDQENNSSVVLKLTGIRNSLLFTGDIEQEAEEDIAHIGRRLSSDIVKVPHHGSRTSVHDLFFSRLSPSIAVLSVGRENTFGHPSSEVLEKLAKVKIFRTDTDGAIKITETKNGVVVKTYKKYMLDKAGSLREELQNIKKLFFIW
jgi:competence protein ComEC